MSNNTNDIVGLQAALFDTLRELQNKDKPMEVDRARAICEVGSVIINAAKTEIDFARVNGSVDSEFFNKPLLGHKPNEKEVSGQQAIVEKETTTGLLTVVGNTTTHTAR